jgi:hypothetical protein
MNSKICNDSDPKFKQRWHDVFDTANRYAADYILQGEDEVVTGPHGNDIPSREVRIDAMATAVADFDTIRVLHNVIKVLEETGDLDEQDLAAALGKTLTAWSKKWPMP